MGIVKTDIEEFVGAFNEDPGGREKLVDGLVTSEGRFLLNLPGRSAARLIAERLREKPFSVFYDFEMILARRLHPRLADLKLNIFADISVNALFDERYRPYAADAAVALAKRGGMSRLRGIVTRMVSREGHRMVIKFCDLVLRWADPVLYRTMRPVEACIAAMKEGRRAGDPVRFDRISGLYEEFAAKEGESAAGALLARMEWDADLRGFVPGLEEAYGAGAAARDEAVSVDRADWQDEADTAAEDSLSGAEISTSDEEDAMLTDTDRGEVQESVPGGRPGKSEERERPAADARTSETRTERYARILKKDYLDRKSPGDEAGIRRLIERIEEKNGRAFGDTRAAEIVDEVLAVWSGDDSIDGVKRSLVTTILDERQAGTSGEDGEGSGFDDSAEVSANTPGAAKASGEEPVSGGEMEALLNELTAEPAAGDMEEAQAEIPDGSTTELAGEETASDLVMEDAAEVLAELDAEVSGDTGGGSAGQAADEESFLIENNTQTGSGREKQESGKSSDESYLIGQDSIMEIPVEGEPVKEDVSSAADDGITSSIEEFAIKDEILFQDSAEKRRKTRAERARKGMRITKIDISEPDEL